MFLGDGVAVVTYHGLILLSYIPHFENLDEGYMVLIPSVDPKYCHLTLKDKARECYILVMQRSFAVYQEIFHESRYTHELFTMP